MEQIKAHIAVSLDGHTATPDYELDWMPREVKELAAREHAAASCLLMGANTYNYIFEHWGGWPHKSKRSFVVSHYDTNVTPDCGVEFLTAGQPDNLHRPGHGGQRHRFCRGNIRLAVEALGKQGAG